MKIKEITVVLLLGILLVTACTCSSTAPETEPAKADVQIPTKNMSCEEISAGTYNCRCYLTGTVKNIGDGDATVVDIRAEFFDANGTKLGEDSEFIGKLAAGESANFAIVDDEAECASTYEVWADWREAGEGWCFIATAAYGTSVTEEIDTLRAFRDEVLLQNSLGSQFVDFYYEVSPPMADFISEHDGLRTLVRELLVAPIASLVEVTEALWQK
jgi:hypothetical protein